MRNLKLNKGLLTVFLALFVSVAPSFGQELATPSFESYTHEPAGVSASAETVPESTDPQKPAPAASSTDSIAFSKPTTPRSNFKPSHVVPKAKSTDQQKDDDSVLTFNFLYYLIQKYKMQDIVD